MREQNYQKKTFQSNFKNEFDRMNNERFNDYGYNFDTTKESTVSLENTSSKTGPNCLGKRLNSEKR